MLRPDPAPEDEAPTHIDLVALEGGQGSIDDEDTTSDLYPESPDDRPGWHVRLFGTHEFFRLWLVQVVSALGDWMGFSAIILLAARIGGVGAGAGAISLVMAARIIPGFIFGPVAGVLVDRWDRRRTMIVCDLGRAAVIATLPFVDKLWGLVLVSLVLEVFTLLWSPAKDATVPNLVPPDRLTSANSLSLAAAYGTFPFAALLFAALAGVSSWLSQFNAFELLAARPDVPRALCRCAHVRVRSIHGAHAEAAEAHATDEPEDKRVDLAKTFTELKEGWHYIFLNHTVRAVNVGLATGLIGGGMLIPLGAVYSTEVLGAGAAGYGLFTTALGFGVATGAIAVSALQKRIAEGACVHRRRCSSPARPCSWPPRRRRCRLPTAAVFVMGVFVGPVYVLGFVLLQEEVGRRSARSGVQLAQHVGAAVRAGVDGRWPAAGRRSRGVVRVVVGRHPRHRTVQHPGSRCSPRALAGRADHRGRRLPRLALAFVRASAPRRRDRRPIHRVIRLSCRPSRDRRRPGRTVHRLRGR